MDIRSLAVLLLAATLAVPASGGRAKRVPHPDHHELEAGLSVPFQGEGARALELSFRFPDAASLMAVLWRMEIASSRGVAVRTLHGETALPQGAAKQRVEWDGRDGYGVPLPEGFYEVRLTARAAELAELRALSGDSPRSRVERHLARADLDPAATSAAELAVGRPPAPRLQPFQLLPSAGAPRLQHYARAATGGLPYTVYYGNLHSQTNHSDGGSAIATCGGAEVPQQGQAGPPDAWEMMRTQAGGDILVTSEHNHMYDGSTALNGAADAFAARARFALGLQLAADYRFAHPGFLALYGTEFGVISNGGHVNIFNPDALATWESNTSGQLIGDVLVPKSDYPALYATMKQRGWVGQFNHPDTVGQFLIGAQSLAYDPNGDEVMTLCEVTNTSGFSATLNETDTSRNSFESACQKLLESGYHFSFASNQDNHCANYGLSYTNRTAVLIPSGDSLTPQTFVAALRARRAFATFDKQGQIVLTTGAGAVMGDRVQNVNALALNVLWASANPARSVSRVRILEGVPGRNGTVTQLSDGQTSVAITPAVGKHFYYATITEDNGDKLWSAPIWVEQLPGLVNAQVIVPAAGVEVQSGGAVTFNGAATTSNASIAAQAWDFGDGGTATGAVVTHAFSNPGTTPVSFAVTYTATDNKGVAGSATRMVTIDPDVRLNTPPTISAIAPAVTPRDTPLSGIAFTVGDLETPAALLEVSAISLDKTLIADETLRLSGEGVSRTLALAPSGGRTGTATILVTVADGGRAFETASFTVTVGTAPPALILSQYYEGLSNNKWIEITNVGAGAYDSSSAPLWLGLWTNPFTGGNSYSITPITATIAPGASVLYKNTSAVLPGAANLTGAGTSSSALTFNGDDVSYLTTVGTADAAGYAARTDAIGENSAAWASSVAGGAGKDRSFVRNRAVTRPGAVYKPAEWAQFTNAQVDAAAAGVTERLGLHLYNLPPTISEILDQTLIANQSTGPLPFTIGDAETPAASLVLTATSSNEVVLPAAALVFGGTGASRTLTATPVADQSGITWVGVTVTDTDGSSTTESFVLTVNPKPSGIARVVLSPATAFLPNSQTQLFAAAVTGLGSFSSTVTWTASGGTVQQNGLYTPPPRGGPYTVTATSVQDPAKSGSATVFTNRAPAATPQAVSTNEDTAVSLVLSGSDPDGDPLTFAVSAAPAHGSLSGAAPNLTYTPARDYWGPDSFTFFVNDGNTDSGAAVVSLTVLPVNDPPTAQSQARSLNEDTPTAIVLTGADPDNDPLTFTVITVPAHGTLSGVAPNLVYTPAADFSGGDSFTYKVSDGKVDSAAATVSLTVVPVNDAPVAKASTRTVPEDTPRSFTLTGTDAENDPLTFAIVTPPLHGALSGALPAVTYTPASNYFGPDSFTFKVNDGQADSAPAKVSITVTPVNDAPVAAPMSRSTNEDTAISVTLGGRDVDGDPLTWTVVGLPAHGTLSGAAPNLTYTPAPDYSGSDSFTYKVSDGLLDSAPALVTLTINPINDAPVAIPQALSAAEDGQVSLTLAGTDIDSSGLTFRVLSPPSHGALTGTPPALVYRPLADFNGADAFTFVADDGALSSQPATVSILVTAVNDAPVAAAQHLGTDEDLPLALRLTASDVDGDPLTFTTSLPAHGSLSGAAPDLIYTPAADFNGTDAFTFVANDGTVDSVAAVVTIDVRPVNDAPVPTAKSVNTNEDTPLPITLSGTDKDLDSLAYAITTPPAHGTLSGSGASQTYTPAANYNGPDSFSFSVNDGVVESQPAVISITVNPVNDAPVALGQTLNLLRNQASPATLVAVDVDGDALTYTVVMPPAHGTLSGAAPALTYTPVNNYAGADAFTFRVNDGALDSNVATVAIVITATNRPPMSQAALKTTNEDTAVAVTLVATDPDGDSLSYAVITLPLHGTLSGAPPTLTYTPAPNYNGSDSFVFTAFDGELTSQPATVTLAIAPVNDPPVAISISRTLSEDQPRTFTIGGTDADGDVLTYKIKSGPLHGTLTGVLPEVTYSPNLNYNGTDNFKFVVNDGTVDSAQATVSLTIKPVNDAPVATAQAVSTAEDTPRAITLSATDVDSTVLTYAVVSQPLHGTLTGAPPALTYTPAANYNGTDSFSFTATDDGLPTPPALTSAPATISITVTAVNDAPVANPQAVSLNEDTSVQIRLSGSDVEGSPLTFTVLQQPAHGVLVAALSLASYTPLANYNGPESFTFKVNDGLLDSAPATVSLTVQPVNDAPRLPGALLAPVAPLSTAEDTPLLVTLAGSDVDLDVLSYLIDVPPEHGTLSGSGGSLVYTPAPDYHGPDAFTWHLSDGLLDSELATVYLVITPVNDAPVALPQAVSTDEDSSLTLTLEGRDVEQSPLTFSIAVNPTHGTLSGALPIVTYTPTPDYNGQDSFAFRVNDGQLDSADALVSIVVRPVNDPPVASELHLSTNEDTAVQLTLTGTDVDGDELSFALATLPAHGTLSGTPPALTYTPLPNFNGADSFTFRVSDGKLDSAATPVILQVVPVNDAPVAKATSRTVYEDTPRSFVLTGVDVDGDPLTFRITQQPAHGTVSGTLPVVVYTPFPDYHGNDSFKFVVNDGKVDSAPATASLTINGVNDPPVAHGQGLRTREDTPLAISLAADDVDLDRLSYVVVAPPVHGALTGSGGALVYTPEPDFNGQDSFSFTAADAQFTSAPETVIVTVDPVNDPPVALPQALATDEDRPLQLLLAASDTEGDALVFAVTVPPAHGTLTGAAPALTYTPARDYNGPDSFKFVADDGHDLSAEATVTVTIAPVNDAPRAVAQALRTLAGNALPLTLIASDPEGDPVTFAVTAGPAHGTLSGTAPALTYAPAPGFTGDDSFTFVASDGALTSQAAEIALRVLPLPAGSDRSVGLLVGRGLHGRLSARTSGSARFVLVTGPALGEMTLAPDGEFTYAAHAGARGADRFTWRVEDDNGPSAEATFAIRLNGADLDADGKRDGVDLGMLAAALGSTSVTADLDGDSAVTDQDLAIFLSRSEP